MKKILWLLCALALTGSASANMLITEVMYAPTQTQSDTDGEWIELYNNGEDPIDLTEWTIDGYNFDDTTINPGQYLVVARELTDGSDTDSESFETAWGNGDGVWDENDGFAAVDGYFSLGVDDTIILTNGLTQETLYYNISYGADNNGKTLERLNLSEQNYPENWAESQEVNGTPGHARYETTADTRDINVNATINNIAPTIIAAEIITDDSEEEGIQIMPLPDSEKEVLIQVTASDPNGVGDISEIEIRILNRTINLQKHSIDSSTALFNGSFSMQPQDIAGLYSAEVAVKDTETATTTNLAFEYMGMLSSVIETSYIQFSGLNPGQTSEAETIILKNTGNIPMDSDISGSELTSEQDTIPLGNLEVDVQGVWQQLSTTPLPLGLNINPGISGEIRMRLSVPENTRSGNYGTALRIISKEA